MHPGPCTPVYTRVTRRANYVYISALAPTCPLPRRGQVRPELGLLLVLRYFALRSLSLALL